MPTKKSSPSKRIETQLEIATEPKADNNAQTDGGVSYEEGIAQLESLVVRMEDGALSLEQMLADYERGMALHAHLDALLKRGEQRIQMLQIPLNRSDEAGVFPENVAWGRVPFEVEE